jgi:autotransporter-associated beta strand protein/T5SS/PEP-CTERM-associated repeat protein
MSVDESQPGLVARVIFSLWFRLGVTVALTGGAGTWLALRIPADPAAGPPQAVADAPVLDPTPPEAGTGFPADRPTTRSDEVPAAAAPVRPFPETADPQPSRAWGLPGSGRPDPWPIESHSAARPTVSVNGPTGPQAPFVVLPNTRQAAVLPPALPGFPTVQPASSADDVRRAAPGRRGARPARLPAFEDGDKPAARRAAGSGASAVWALNANGSTTVDVGSLLAANRFYAAGYTGTNARIANIEGGTPWRGHESLNWIPAGNVYASGAGLTETSTPTSSITPHATATSMNLAGKAPAGASDPTLQRGIAYGINPNNFFAGNIASTITGNNFEWSAYSDFRNVYYWAVVQGIGSGANRVDVVSSSWGGDASNATEGAYNLFRASRIVDSILFEGNQTRGSTMVFAAGNGSGANTIGSPATGFNSIAVGALGEFGTDPAGTAVYNVAASFSSRGPIEYRQPGSSTDLTGTSLGVIRPRIDIAAPGSSIRLATMGSASSYQGWNGTSFAAPTVAGGAALLADYARTALGANDADFAVDGRVMKAVLVNSADKTAGWDNGQTWNGTRWATTRGLDYATGGGRMNLDQAFGQYVNGHGNTVSQLINPSGAGPHAVLPTGWARATIDRPNAATAASQDFVLNGTLARNSELNATLSWFVNGAVTSNNATVLGFHNLDLEVWLADGSGVPQTRVAVSTADHNNVEHLSFLVPETGRYVVRVARPSDANGGTYYSFPGDTTSDVFGLAWMVRPGLQALAGTTTVSSGSQSQANVLIAPDAGQTATLAVSGSGTRLNALNRLFVGGTDRGPGGTGTLTVSGGATVDVSNTLRVFGGGTVAVAGSTLSGGVLAVDPGASFTVSGTSVIHFSRVDASAPIVVPAGGDVTVRSFQNGGNTGRLNLLAAAATFEVGGQLTLHPVVTGSNGLVKNGTGTLVLATTNGAPNAYTGTTQVNAGTLRLGAANVIPDASPVRLGGGTLSTGASTGFSDTVGPLELAAASTIALGTGTHALTFSGLTGTPAGVLSVTGWTGTPGLSGNGGDILFTGVGSNPNGSLAAFLGTVQFQGYPLGLATFILSSGTTYELVPAPVPEPATILAVAFGGLFFGRAVVRRVRRKAPAEAAIAP